MSAPACLSPATVPVRRRANQALAHVARLAAHRVADLRHRSPPTPPRFVVYEVEE